MRLLIVNILHIIIVKVFYPIFFSILKFQTYRYVILYFSIFKKKSSINFRLTSLNLFFFFHFLFKYRILCPCLAIQAFKYMFYRRKHDGFNQSERTRDAFTSKNIDTTVRKHDIIWYTCSIKLETIDFDSDTIFKRGS